MSKAFMVIDMPENCKQCPLNMSYGYEGEDDGACGILEKYPKTSNNKRLDYCPLIPIEGT